MTPDRKTKLADIKRTKQEQAKLERQAREAKAEARRMQETQALLEAFKAEIKTLIDQQADRTEQLVKALSDLDQTATFEGLGRTLKDILEKVDRPIRVDVKHPDIKVPEPKVTVKTEKLHIPEGLAQEESVKGVLNQIRELKEQLKPDQDPYKFVPYRRVIRDGKKLKFDDNPTGSSGGGGGGGSASLVRIRDKEEGNNQLAIDAAGQIGVNNIGDISLEAAPTFKDDPAAGGETPKYGKRNSSTLKPMVEATIDAALPAGTNQIGFTDSRFARVAKVNPSAGEEVRMDDISAGDLYIGMATAGTATSATGWSVVKYSRTTTGAITRIQFLDNQIWDNRASLGW